MAQPFIHNFDKVSPLGYKQPANDPNAASPDYITHAQLRYSPFTSSEAIAGSVVSGANSTFSFSIEDAQIAYTFKMYYSTDGTTYTEDKTFGGADGKKLFGANDLSGYATLGTAQSITAIKTFTALPVSSVAPTGSTQFTNKAYVDGLVGWKTCVFWIDSFTPDESIALSYRRIYNNTGVTPTLTYGTSLFGAQGLRITFNRTSSNSDVILPPKLFVDDGFGSKNPAGFLGVSETFSQNSANTTMDLYYVDDSLQTWNVSQVTTGGVDVWSTFTLSGGTLTRAAGTNPPNTDQKFLAATLSRNNPLLAATSEVVTSAPRLNFRIELRFYD